MLSGCADFCSRILTVHSFLTHSKRHIQELLSQGTWSSIWSSAGDVYHLLFDLSMTIHGRVWPEKDRPAVKRLMSLIRHVTGLPSPSPSPPPSLTLRPPLGGAHNPARRFMTLVYPRLGGLQQPPQRQA